MVRDPLSKEAIMERQEWSQEATAVLIAKILTGDKSPLSAYCKQCREVTEWKYFGYASLVGLTYRCKTCGASTYNGMADFKRSEGEG